MRRHAFVLWIKRNELSAERAARTRISRHGAEKAIVSGDRKNEPHRLPGFA